MNLSRAFCHPLCGTSWWMKCICQLSAITLLSRLVRQAMPSARTMGLLLLISPPGYGKTTLMEYLANRMGLIFMKINGPALGHEVTSPIPRRRTTLVHVRRSKAQPRAGDGR